MLSLRFTFFGLSRQLSIPLSWEFSLHYTVYVILLMGTAFKRSLWHLWCDWCNSIYCLYIIPLLMMQLSIANFKINHNKWFFNVLNVPLERPWALSLGYTISIVVLYQWILTTYYTGMAHITNFFEFWFHLISKFMI